MNEDDADEGNRVESSTEYRMAKTLVGTAPRAGAGSLKRDSDLLVVRT